jgi:hypothetical protein
MRILIDENMSSPRLAAAMLAAGHDVEFSTAVGLCTALANLASAGIPIDSQVHVLNQWR